jgi:hypothetical protein
MNESRIVPLLLRAIAIYTALAVMQTAMALVPFAITGQLRGMAASGLFGVVTIGSWLLTLVVGPVAAINLFQLKPIGLRLTAALCAAAVLYYLAAIFLLRVPEGQGTPPLGPLIVNTASLILVLSPTARRACGL